MSAALRLPVVDTSPERPKNRIDCVDGHRPCPWVSCRYHLLIHEVSSNGVIRINRATVESRRLDDGYYESWSDDDIAAAIKSLPHSCSLDAAIMGHPTRERKALKRRAPESAHPPHGAVAETVEQLALALEASCASSA